MHDDDLSYRLRFAESDFLAALESGTTALLTSYRQTWSALPDALHTGSKTGDVGNETLRLAHLVASRITSCAECLLNIIHGVESSKASLQSDCDAMIYQMATLDINANPMPMQPARRNNTRSRSHSGIPAPCGENPSPSSLEPAYEWLMDNLHNPYPTAEVKTRLATASSCKVSSINSWFINTRRRIGWTTLCREHFSNCRADMIDAAYRALVEEDPQRPLSPALIHSFIVMKVATEDLYPTTFTRSAFARDLESIVKDIMNKDQGSDCVEECPQIEQANLTKAIQDVYPSPNRSSTASPLPTSNTDTHEEDDGATPPIIAGSKRPWSSVEPPDQPSCTANRPIKRLRASVASPAHLPSPPSSIDGTDEPSDHGSPEASTTVHPTQVEAGQLLPSSKQYVSNVNTTGVSNHPPSLIPTPHPYTASDPLPDSYSENDYSIDDWLNINFDSLFAIPPPVEATEPDSSTPWEVELFKDYNIPENPKHTAQHSSTSMLDLRLSAPTDLCDLESILQSIRDDAPVAPLETVPIPDVSGPANTAAFDSLVSEIPHNLQPEIDWMSLLNAAGTYQPTVDPTLLHYPQIPQPLPEISLSMLQLPHVAPVSKPPDPESKEAKLRRLHAMQEEVRRMEQELQLEGIAV